MAELTIEYFLQDTVEAVNNFFGDAVKFFSEWKSTKDPYALLDAFEAMALAWHHLNDLEEVAKYLPIETAKKYSGFLTQTPVVLQEWYDKITREANKIVY